MSGEGKSKWNMILLQNEIPLVTGKETVNTVGYHRGIASSVYNNVFSH